MQGDSYNYGDVVRGSTNWSKRVQTTEVWSFLEANLCDFGNTLCKFAYVATKCGIIHTKRDMLAREQCVEV